MANNLIKPALNLFVRYQDMFGHECKIDDMVILGERYNPIDSEWPPCSLVICRKCKKVREWQVHSPEGMHGGAPECTAFPRIDYVSHIYHLADHDIEAILSGKRKTVRYDWHKKNYIDA